MSNLQDISVTAIDGTEGTLRDLSGGKPTLVVNVASECGLTPQYAGLQRLYDTYGPRGFSVVGVPCNQFGAQEPGDAAEICSFTQRSYDVTFPLTEKLEVNGPARHPLYEAISATPDAEGYTGDIRWNFEKALIGADGEIIARFDPRTEPDDPKVIEAVEKVVTG